MPLQVEVLFELIKGLIVDLDGTIVEEVSLRVLLEYLGILFIRIKMFSIICYLKFFIQLFLYV